MSLRTWWSGKSNAGVDFTAGNPYRTEQPYNNGNLTSEQVNQMIAAETVISRYIGVGDYANADERDAPTDKQVRDAEATIKRLRG